MSPIPSSADQCSHGGTTGTSKASSRRTDPQRDAQRTRRRILAEATAEFADRGFSSARVEDIAGRTATTKRMIYYYFGSKESLFVAVLEHALATPRLTPPDEAAADPVAAIGWLVRQIFEDDEEHPERVRLLSIANIHHARHMTGFSAHRDHRPPPSWLASVLRRGAEQGVFRTGVDPEDLLTVVGAVSVYRVSHRASVQVLREIDLLEPQVRQRQLDMVAEMVLAYLRPDQAAT